nr:MAG TPA: hypothetical protein [Caudoviricetes sp.]
MDLISNIFLFLHKNFSALSVGSSFYLQTSFVFYTNRNLYINICVSVRIKEEL